MDQAIKYKACFSGKRKKLCHYFKVSNTHLLTEVVNPTCYKNFIFNLALG